MPAGSIEREFLDVVEHRNSLMAKYPGFINSNVENPLPELWVYTTVWTEKVRARAVVRGAPMADERRERPAAPAGADAMPARDSRVRTRRCGGRSTCGARRRP